MRTIEESIAVLEKWREEDIDNRHFSIHSVVVRYDGDITFPEVILSDEIAFDGYAQRMKEYSGSRIQEALDKAASAVEGE